LWTLHSFQDFVIVHFDCQIQWENPFSAVIDVPRRPLLAYIACR
jgi:hypothetical protein